MEYDDIVIKKKKPSTRQHDIIATRMLENRRRADRKRAKKAAKKKRAAKGSCGAGYSRKVHALGMNIGKGYCARTSAKPRGETKAALLDTIAVKWGGILPRGFKSKNKTWLNKYIRDEILS